jgi:prepilin-type N-terminal cleavage/methylation domain-containing protein
MNAEEAMNKRIRQKGFSLLEMLVALAILVIVAGTVIAGMIRMTWSQSTIMNRTQVHSSVRNATELMQQEIGQAGRIGASTGLSFKTNITAASSPTLTMYSTSGTPTYGLYVGEQLVVDPSSTNEETVTLTAVDPAAGTVKATFANAHNGSAAAPLPVLVMGGFASGIVPPTGKFVFSTSTGTSTTNTTLDNGVANQSSSGTALKLYGDLNGDGNMIYVVYQCSPNSSGTGTLTRYATSSTGDITTSATAPTGTVLLDTLANNPNSSPCFTYATKDAYVNINGGQVMQTFVINVAVTLTVQTQSRDLQTRVAQAETKALLNIAPRNVFDAWQLASSPAGYTRAQPMPGNVLNNLVTSIY